MKFFHPFNGSVNDPKSMATLTFETMVFGTVAIILGSLINKAFDRIRGTRKHSKILSMAQILVSAIMIAVMYVYLPFEFVGHFQKTLPGMVFPGLFYGVQSNIYAGWS